MKKYDLDIVEIRRGDGSIVLANPRLRTLTHKRYKVSFTPTEWNILFYLYEKRPNVVSRGEILELIWGKGSIVPTRTVDVHVGNIRKKLNYIKGAKILSVYGSGYRLLMLKRF